MLKIKMVFERGFMETEIFTLVFVIRRLCLWYYGVSTKIIVLFTRSFNRIRKVRVFF